MNLEIKYNKQRVTEHGNVLFLILLAVALFAALAYAVTGSTRSGGGDASREQSKLIAGKLVAYGPTAKTAIQRMMLINNCTQTQISFNADSDGDGNYLDSGDDFNNSTSPATLQCHIFRPEGGGIPLLTFKDAVITNNTNLDTNVVNWWNSGASIGRPYFFWSNFSGTPANDLVMGLGFVNQDVCTILAKDLWGSNSIQTFGFYPSHAAWSVTSYTTTFTGNQGDYAATLNYQTTGCRRTANSSNPAFPNLYYYVLIEN